MLSLDMKMNLILIQIKLIFPKQRVLNVFYHVLEGKVLVVIGGDDSYKDSSEEQGSFLSRWARRKVSSQFSEELLDGSKSFIFSWNKEHRPIHEEALLHYFNPGKKNKKFVREEKVAVTVSREDPKQVCLCLCMNSKPGTHTREILATR